MLVIKTPEQYAVVQGKNVEILESTDLIEWLFDLGLSESDLLQFLDNVETKGAQFLDTL